MARKQSSVAAATHQHSEANGIQPKRGAKTAAIRELYASGVTVPKEISDEMARHGLSVSMPVIYTTLKALKKASKRKGGRPKAAAVPAAEVSIYAVSAPSPGLTADDLLQLAEITKKAGGVDPMVGLLNAMKHFQ